MRILSVPRNMAGATHITADNVHESWLSDDQVSDMATGGNGPVTRNEGMYNAYTAVKTYWSDTIVMDNLRGGDATGVATPGAPLHGCAASLPAAYFSSYAGLSTCSGSSQPTGV
jgi:hypothetical protein